MTGATGDIRRVLVVEDGDDMRLLVTLSLETGGYEVTAVRTAEEALPHLDDHDLLLLDIRLPGMSGLDLLRHHVDAGGRAPALMMSAHAGEDVRREALEAGAIGLLQKPFQLHELVAAVEKLDQ